VTRWLLRRLAQAVLTFLVVTVLLFVLMRLTPGDPLERLTGDRQVSAQETAALRRRFGIDQPITTQFRTFVTGALSGDLGVSIEHYPTRVSTLLATRLPASLLLGGTVLLLTFGIGIVLATAFGGASLAAIHQWLFEDVAAVSDTELEGMRGGFTIPSLPHVQISFGFEIRNRIDLPDQAGLASGRAAATRSRTGLEDSPGSPEISAAAGWRTTSTRPSRRSPKASRSNARRPTSTISRRPWARPRAASASRASGVSPICRNRLPCSQSDVGALSLFG